MDAEWSQASFVDANEVHGSSGASGVSRPSGLCEARSCSRACSYGGRSSTSASTRARSSYQTACLACRRALPQHLGAARARSRGVPDRPTPRLASAPDPRSSRSPYRRHSQRTGRAQACRVAGPWRASRAPVLGAVAPHGASMAEGAVPAARPRAVPTLSRTAEADQRERRREGEVVELIERSNTRDIALSGA